MCCLHNTLCSGDRRCPPPRLHTGMGDPATNRSTGFPLQRRSSGYGRNSVQTRITSQILAEPILAETHQESWKAVLPETFYRLTLRPFRFLPQGHLPSAGLLKTLLEHFRGVRVHPCNLRTFRTGRDGGTGRVPCEWSTSADFCCGAGSQEGSTTGGRLRFRKPRERIPRFQRRTWPLPMGESGNTLPRKRRRGGPVWARPSGTVWQEAVGHRVTVGPSGWRSRCSTTSRLSSSVCASSIRS